FAMVTAALMVSLGAFVGTPGAVATQGQPIDAGTVNTETKATVVNDTSVVVSNCIQYNDTGLVGCGGTGLDAEGTAFGVRAKANSTPQTASASRASDTSASRPMVLQTASGSRPMEARGS